MKSQNAIPSSFTFHPKNDTLYCYRVKRDSPHKKRAVMAETNDYKVLLDVIKRRRTIRQFKPDPVADEDIKRIIEAARWAPSGFHTQPWEFVVINDPDVKSRVVAALDTHGPAIQDPAKKDVQRASFRDAPVFILALCDWRASAGLPGSAPRTREQANNLYQSSMVNAFLYMHLAATALGLASQWYTATSRPETERAIREIIGIPNDLTIYDMMVVGYEAAPAGPKIVRELDSVMHFNDCGQQDFRSDEEMTRYAETTKAWCLGQH
jgi:nitroreductase